MRGSSSSEGVVASSRPVLLREGHRRLHRALLDAVLATGSFPGASALAVDLGVPAVTINAGFAALAAADYLALDEAGRVVCLYPFSVTPTAHVVVFDGQRRYAMCAVDALGIPAMLGKALAVEGRCPVCETPIALQVRPGAIVSAAPPTTMVVACRDETVPAYAASCPFTVFVCGREHAGQFGCRVDGAHTLSLAEALMDAEEIFGALLANAVPAMRPRGKPWGSRRDG